MPVGRVFVGIELEGKSMTKAGDAVWGGICGAVLGFIVAKIFETWSILFIQYGVHNGSYLVGPFTTPLWVRAANDPILVTVLTVILYGSLGILFVLYRHHRAGCEQIGNEE